MANKYSCIIAAYNENPRILDVLNIVTRIKAVTEVICVDDGSTDGTSTVVKKKFPKVKLLQHISNKGKVAAIKSGVEKARENYLLMIDADLISLKISELEKAINIFEENRLDCLILLTLPTNIYYRIVRSIFSITNRIAGDRVIRKDYLQKVLRDATLTGYGLEVALNRYLMDNKKSVARYELSAIDAGKTQKWGIKLGIIKEILMWKQIIATTGTLSLVKQSFFFANHKFK